MSKGSAQAAQTLLGQQGAAASQYNTAATGVSGQLTPFLENELNNPQGFGQQGLSQLQTQAGQATAGALGAGKEAALLNASRTGNASAVPGVIDATTRGAMQQQSNNVLGTNLANDELKQKQQQAGASGLQDLYGTDVGAALKSLGLEDDSINAWTGAKTAAGNSMWQSINGIDKLVGQAGTAILGGGGGG